MKLAVIQLGINDEESKEQKIQRVESIIDHLEDIDLIVLPELWNIGFFNFDQYKEKSESLEGLTVSRLSQKAKEKNVYIFTGSFVEKRGDKYYNTAVLLNREGDRVGGYSKIHLFGYGSAEREILDAGKKIEVVDTEFGKIGFGICYDLRFPEIYRKMVDKGAEIIINCTAWPYPRVEHWNILNQARAIENQCYFINCSCAGQSKGKAFIGRSMILDPWGSIVNIAAERETVLIAEINPKSVKEIREDFTPIKDRVIKL